MRHEDNNENHLKTLILWFSPKYMIIGFEIGKEGTHHIQGYADFQNARTLGGLTRDHKFIHWEPRRGSWQQAVDYCKKDGNWFEYGSPNEQGQRKDLQEVHKEIANGKRVDQIALENPNCFHQYGRTLNKLEDLYMRKRYRTEMTKGIWYYGKTGVGKSHLAFDGFTPETHYLLPNDSGWWDGYTQQDTVIINDFRGEIPYNQMLQMIDKWPFSVKRRNREPLPFTSKTVIITSSLPPWEVYNKRNEEDSIGQLLRRLVVIPMNTTYTTDAQHSTEVPGGNTRPPVVPDNNTEESLTSISSTNSILYQ